MSNDLVQTDVPRSQNKPGPKLSESQKRAIIAQVAVTGDKSGTARMFGVHPNTITTLCKSVTNTANSPLSTQWRAPMLQKAVQATNEGLTYRGKGYDPYKAMTGGIAVLKGLGEFNADLAVNVAQLISNVPAGLDLDAPQPSSDAAFSELTPQQVDGD